MRAIDRLLRHRPTAGGMSLAGKIKALFSNGEQGWWYDPSNFATLFQDSAGTTPVTAVEQPVGLQLDLSKGLVLGSEILTNGTFDSSIAGWTAGAGSAAWVAGTAQITGSSGVIARLYQAMTLTAGQWYRMTATCVSTTDASATLEFLGGSVSTTFTAGQTKSLYFSPASTGTFYAQVRNTNAGAVVSSFDNISVQSLAGNHRFQTTSANRPVVSARVNLLTTTDNLSNADYAPFQVTKSVNTITSPLGDLTATALRETTSTSIHILDGTPPFSVVSGATYIARISVQAAGRTKVSINAGSGWNTNGSALVAYYDLSTTTVDNVAAGVTATITARTGGWYDLTYAVAANVTGSIAKLYFGLVSTGTTTSYTGDPTKGVNVWGIDIRFSNQGVGLPVYQRVNTSTDYDSTGFPTYIKPNGSNQWMQTNSINFSSTDKMTVWQGVRKLSDANRAVVIELSTTVGTGGTFLVSAPNLGAANYGVIVNGGGALNGKNFTTYASPITNVLSASLKTIATDVDDAVSVRINAISNAGTATGTGVGTGNFINAPAYFYMRAGTSLPFNGNDYGSIARGAASTAAQITAGETYINSKTRAFA